MSLASHPTVILIAAVARNRVIGRNNQLLWQLPEDMAHFRRHTQGHAVIMGRNTWQSLPERFRPLPGRRNVVLSRQPNWQAPGAEVCDSLQAALTRLAGLDRVFVIGGEQVYAAALPYASTLLLTEIDHDFDGDAYFPLWDRQQFVEQSRQNQQAPKPNDWAYSFVTYQHLRS